MVIDGIEMICRVNDDKSYRYWLNNIVPNKWLPAKPGEVVDEQ